MSLSIPNYTHENTNREGMAMMNQFDEDEIVQFLSIQPTDEADERTVQAKVSQMPFKDVPSSQRHRIAYLEVKDASLIPPFDCIGTACVLLPLHASTQTLACRVTLYPKVPAKIPADIDAKSNKVKKGMGGGFSNIFGFGNKKKDLDYIDVEICISRVLLQHQNSLSLSAAKRDSTS